MSARDPELRTAAAILAVLAMLSVAACSGADAPAGDAGTDDGPEFHPAPDAVAPPEDLATPVDLTGCVDPCPAPGGGLTVGCTRRFAVGTNWAWIHFGADFGGISAWGQPGVSQARVATSDHLAALSADGVRVVRWWMFPRFFTDSISFAADGTPSGMGGTLIADIAAALELAEQHDVYLVLTLFSFDGFKPTATVGGIDVPGLRPIVVSAFGRQRLFENVIKPVARAVEQSPQRTRMLAWDLINEPEWAMTGPSLYGDPSFAPTAGLEAVTHGQMETFLVELAATLRAHSSAQLTIGSAAIKWAHAWKNVPLDFDQLHYYGWVYEWYPYTTVTLQAVGLTSRPVVMGEHPNAGLDAISSKGLPARTLLELQEDLWQAGYAGAWSWAYNDSGFPWIGSSFGQFGGTHACETTF